jgi:hypothetical protein
MAPIRASLALPLELTGADESVSVRADEDAAYRGSFLVRKTGTTAVPPFGSVIVDEPAADCVPFAPPLATPVDDIMDVAFELLKVGLEVTIVEPPEPFESILELEPAFEDIPSSTLLNEN